MRELTAFGIIFFFIILSSNLNAQDDYKIINLGNPINSFGDDYAPVISPDGLTLFFVSVRDGSILNSKGKPTHDFWGVKRTNRDKLDFQIPFNLDPDNPNGVNGLNSLFDEGVATFSPDGKKVYFTACGRSDEYGNCDIYMVELKKGNWSRAINLGSNVNSIYWDTQPSISPDGNRLYFTSNRPGPNGEKNIDIWYSDYDFENEEWGESKNLTQINTTGRECGPFIAPDNVTLFFSSDNYKPNLGGLDFYVTRFDLEFKSWGQPAHLSAPISTLEDDLFISLPASGDIMFFSSLRKDIQGVQGGLDIFAAYTKAMFNAVVLKITVKDDKTGEYIFSNITIKNPLTGRIIKDEITPEKPEIDLVISDTDFGDKPDSVKYVDWEIVAESEEHGITTQTVRVDNPKHPEFNDFRAFSDNIGITLEFAVKSSDVAAERVDTTNQSILSAYKNLVAFKDGKLVKLDTIFLKQQSVNVAKPLLNYVFFDENSSNLSERYIQIKKDRIKSFSFSSFHNQKTLYVYCNLLNIIGKRMTDFPEANIELVGCNMDFDNEKGNIALSEKRAETIKNYLTSVWNINPERINIKTRNLPEKSSNSTIPEGREENRRVEIYSDYSEITAPILTNDTMLIAEPEIIRFVDPVGVKFGEAFWTISIFDKNQNYKEFFGEGPTQNSIDWNTNDLTKYSSFGKDVKYEIVVNDKQIRKTIVGKDSIPIKLVKLSAQEEKKIEKFSLILFDFGSNKIGNANKNIIETINSKIHSNSDVRIIGYTDIIGDDNFNLRLSKSRSAEALKLIKHNRKQSDGLGEKELLYDNSLPEGRFYCRTVEITVEN